jgi:hypothetical protein
MIDRTTKILLGLIATGLWMNVVTLQTRPAAADSALLSSIDRTLLTMEGHLSDLVSQGRSLSDIATGYCSNRKLC